MNSQILHFLERMRNGSTHLGSMWQTAESNISQQLQNWTVLRNNTVYLNQLHCTLSNAQRINGNILVTHWGWVRPQLSITWGIFSSFILRKKKKIKLRLLPPAPDNTWFRKVFYAVTPNKVTSNVLLAEFWSNLYELVYNTNNCHVKVFSRLKKKKKLIT